MDPIARLDRSSISNDGLQYVGAWEHFTELYLGNTSVSDAGLNHLTQLRKLKLLDVKNSKVTEAGVAGLAKILPKCTIMMAEQAINPAKLDWSGRTLSEDDFKKLKNATALRELVLSNATFSESHLKYVPGRNLTRLNLANTKVTDDGFRWLDFYAIKELNLSGTQISDAALVRFTRFPPTSLRVIDLSNTKVTDKGLEYLTGSSSGFFKPEAIILTGTKVTAKGVDLIRNKWGKLCKITQ